MGVRKTLEDNRNKVRVFFRTRGFHYRKVFRGESGDWVLKDLLRDAKVNETMFIEDGQRTQDYNLGYRACVLRISKIVRLTPDQIDRMVDRNVREDDDE